MSESFLVLGADGQLGRAFQKILDLQKENCIPKTRNGIDVTYASDVWEQIGIIRPDVIINCAAYVDVERAEEDGNHDVFRVNVDGPSMLAKVAQRYEIPLIHFSTDYVFNGKKNVPYDEIDTPSPLNVYGISKLRGEDEVRANCRKYLIIRSSWLYGNGKNNFPKKVVGWSRNRGEFSVAEDEVSVPTWTEDLAFASLILLRSMKWGTYHVVSSGFCNRFEWAQEIVKQLNISAKVNPARSEDFHMLATRPKYSVLSTAKFEATTGQKMPDWKESFQRFLSS